MEVKIGVQFAPRELTLESTQSHEQVIEEIQRAMGIENGMVSLLDEKGRRLLIPAAKIAYVEIAESESRKVGFAAS